MHNIWMDLTDAIDNPSSIVEMAKKYNNTYLVLISNGKENIVFYKGTQDGLHLFSDIAGVTIKLAQDTAHQLVCVFPERKLFNHKGIALEFIRLSNRQYRRGICKDNTRIYSPVRVLFGGDGHQWNMETLQDALHSTYPANAEEALNELHRNTAISIALSERFMLSLSLEQKYPHRFILFYMNKIIGYFEKDVFFIKHPLFKQEVLDNLTLFKPYRIDF